MAWPWPQASSPPAKKDPLPPSTTETGQYLYEEKYVNGTKTIFTPDASGRIGTTLDYDKTDKPTSTTSFKYDGSGNLIRSSRVLGGKETAAVEYTYFQGQLASAKDFTDSDNNGTLEQIGNITYAVDSSGRLISKQRLQFGSSPGTGGEETYEYDSRGNLTKINKFSISNGNKVPTGTVEMTYDTKRHPLSTFKPPVILTWETTVNNALTFVNKDQNGKVWESRTYTYEYNSEGLPTKKSTTIDNTSFDILYSYKNQ